MCQPPKEASKDQKNLVMEHKNKFEGIKREQKMKLKDKKTARKLKSTWKSSED